jgi:hypothetical protein
MDGGVIIHLVHQFYHNYYLPGSGGDGRRGGLPGDLSVLWMDCHFHNFIVRFSSRARAAQDFSATKRHHDRWGIAPVRSGCGTGDPDLVVQTEDA